MAPKEPAKIAFDYFKANASRVSVSAKPGDVTSICIWSICKTAASRNPRPWRFRGAVFGASQARAAPVGHLGDMTLAEP
jgi:hypothetical protein